MASLPTVDFGSGTVFSLRSFITNPYPDIYHSGWSSLTFSVGYVDSDGDFVSLGSGYNRYELNPDGTVKFGTGSYTNWAGTLGVGSFASADSFYFESSGKVYAVFLDYFYVSSTVNGFFTVAESVPSFFSSGLSIASGIVDFILSSWITAIVLVLYVGIALFGIFRRLFKGA